VWWSLAALEQDERNSYMPIVPGPRQRLVWRGQIRASTTVPLCFGCDQMVSRSDCSEQCLVVLYEECSEHLDCTDGLPQHEAASSFAML
jgi:hypothetical protein